mgnify:CR=1 FL=1
MTTISDGGGVVRASAGDAGVGKGFRPDIQALRAIAVLLVLIYHVWPSLLPGGYIGVDVFFVISGYLITSLLRRELQATGTISFVDFYARRARRLLPASLLLLTAVLAATYALQPMIYWRETAGDVIAGVFYAENWWLHFKSLDYLAANESPSVVQHFWSLSLEEQFYFGWPLLMLAVYALARRSAGHDPLAALRSTLWVVVALSFAFSVWTALQGAPGAGYFSTWTRVWQLGAGGILALGVGAAGSSRPWALLLGLSMIALSAILLAGGGAYPGWWALLPTLGAVLCLADGPSFSAWLSTRWMKWSPVQWVGDISYSLYLWHWPIVVFGKAYFPEGYDWLSGIGVVALSMALAAASKRWIEDVFRYGSLKAASSAKVLVISVAASLSVAVLALLLFFAVPEEEEQPAAAYPGAAALTSGVSGVKEGDFVPALVNVERDVAAAYAQGCIQQVESAEVLRCVYGRDDAAVKIALVGDSHAVHWIPAFEELVRLYDIQVVAMTKTSCPLSDIAVYHNALKRDYDSCLEWSRNVVSELKGSDIGYVVVSQSPSYMLSSSVGDRMAAVGPLSDGMVKLWKELQASGKKVIPLRSTPWQSKVMRECAANNPWPFDACAGDENRVLFDSAIPVAARKAGVTQIDLSPYFCISGKCPAVIGGVFVYRDNAHITATYARTLAPMLLSQLAIGNIKRRESSLDSEPAPVLPEIGTLVPKLEFAKFDRGEAFERKCLQIEGSAPLSCDFGTEAAGPRIAIVGDGMAASIVPAVLVGAESRGWRVSTFLKDSCLFSTKSVYNRRVAGPLLDCDAWSSNVRKSLLELRPDIVVVVQSAVYRKDAQSSPDASRAVLADGVEETWRLLEAGGVPVVAFDYMPTMPFDVPKCLADEKERRTGCFGYTSGTAREGVLTEASDRMGKRMLSLNDQFCPGQYCPPQSNGVLIYRDASQPTATFMRTLGSVLGERLTEVLKDPEKRKR